MLKALHGARQAHLEPTKGPGDSALEILNMRLLFLSLDVSLLGHPARLKKLLVRKNGNIAYLTNNTLAGHSISCSLCKKPEQKLV